MQFTATPWLSLGVRDTVTDCASASEASPVYQVLHGRGARPTSVRYPKSTATPALPMPSFNGVAGMAVAAGIHHDDLRHSTTITPSSAPWFSQRVRQRPDFVHGIARVSSGTVCAAASAVSVGRKNQSTSSDTTTHHTSQHGHGHGAGAPGGSVLLSAACSHDATRASSVGAAVLVEAAAAVEAARAHQAASFNTTTFNTRPCSCSGSSAPFFAKAACVCTVCGSSRHEESRCFISQGVPANVRMRADKVVELCRLHDLCVRGAFDWRTTPTSLAWMLRLRVRHAVPASRGPNLDPSPDDPHDLHGPGGLAQANHCGCEMCCPDNPHCEVYTPDCDPDGLHDPHDLHGPGGLAQANHCGCEVCCPDNPHCEVCAPDCDCELCCRPNLDLSLDGESGGSDGGEGYSSALEDGGMQVDLWHELPPGARIPPERITPAVARARWRSRLGERVPARKHARKLAGARPMRPV